MLPQHRKQKNTIIHFYHPDFRRCKVMDSHLEVRDRCNLYTIFETQSQANAVRNLTTEIGIKVSQDTFHQGGCSQCAFLGGQAGNQGLAMRDHFCRWHNKRQVGSSQHLTAVSRMHVTYIPCFYVFQNRRLRDNRIWRFRQFHYIAIGRTTRTIRSHHTAAERRCDIKACILKQEVHELL